MNQHIAIGNEVVDGGIVHKCSCGWTSPRCFTSFAASCLGIDHREDNNKPTSYDAAPEVKDEPVAWAVTWNGEFTDNLFDCEMNAKTCKLTLDSEHTGDKRDIVPLFTHPSPRIAELEAEVKALQSQLAKARSDALEEAAMIAER